MNILNVIFIVAITFVPLISRSGVIAPLIAAPVHTNHSIKVVQSKIFNRSIVHPEIQNVLNQVNLCISSNNQQEANNIIMRCITSNYEIITFDVGEAVLSKYSIISTNDQIQTDQLKTIIPSEQYKILEPFIFQIKTEYFLKTIESYINEGKNSKSNNMIVDYLMSNTTNITFDICLSLLSNFDLNASTNVIYDMQQISQFYEKCSNQQKLELSSLMSQIKTKYNLIKEKNDLDILNSIYPITINITTINTITLHDLNIYMMEVLTIDLESLNILLTKLDGMLEIDSLNILLTKLESLDTKSLNILLSKIEILTPESLNILLSKIDSNLTFNSLNSILIKLNFLDTKSLNILLSKIDSHTFQTVYLAIIKNELAFIQNGNIIYTCNINDINLNEINIPYFAVMVTQIDTSIVELLEKHKEIYNFMYSLFGLDGMYRPHSNSYMGYQYKRLRKELDAAGPEWVDNENLVTKWKYYLRQLKSYLDRESYFKSKHSIDR